MRKPVSALPSPNRINFKIDVMLSLKERTVTLSSHLDRTTSTQTHLRQTLWQFPDDLLFVVRELKNKPYAKLKSVKLSW